MISSCFHSFACCSGFCSENWLFALPVAIFIGVPLNICSVSGFHVPPSAHASAMSDSFAWLLQNIFGSSCNVCSEKYSQCILLDVLKFDCILHIASLFLSVAIICAPASCILCSTSSPQCPNPCNNILTFDSGSRLFLYNPAYFAATRRQLYTPSAVYGDGFPPPPRSGVLHMTNGVHREI